MITTVGKTRSSLKSELQWLDDSRDMGNPSLIIIDWDDTLLCTSFLAQGTTKKRSIFPSFIAQLGVSGGMNFTPAFKQTLKRIEEVACRLLLEALQLGNTFIVTNAAKGWVEQSAGKYLPGLLPLLQRVTIVSARSTYEGLYPGQQERWKEQAFLKIAREVDMPSYRDLIVIGDSNFEMDAADVVGSIFMDLRIKAVKLTKDPSAQDLLRELQLVVDNLSAFKDSNKSLTITLERQVSGQSGSTSSSRSSLRAPLK